MVISPRVPALVIFILTPLSLFAQTTLDEEELRQRTRRETQERQKIQQTPNTRLQQPLTEIDSLDLPVEHPCFNIISLKLEGSRIDQFHWAQHYIDQYKGQCIGREGINLILKRLSNRLTARGYITARAGLSEQNLSQENLKFVLVPGIIRQIRFIDNHPSSLWKSAFPARPGDVLNLRSLEQGLEQMKRLPSQEVDIQIASTNDSPGESDVILTLKQNRRLRAVISLDDSGSKSTGKLQASLNIAFDNFLNLNDLLNIGLNTDAERDGSLRGTSGNSAYYSLPYGYWTYAFSANNYDYRQTIQGINQSFASRGTSNNYEFKLQRLIHRNQFGKTSLQLRINKRYSRSFLDDTEIEVQRRNPTSVELALQHRHYFGSTQLDFTLAHREGVRWFGGQKDASDRLPDNPTFRYQINTVDANLIVPFKIDKTILRYIGSFRGQTTESPLYVSEFFSIGNRYTVRGFDGEQVLAAERGWYLRNEIEVSIQNSGHAFYTGLDYGEVHGPSANTLIGQRLIGAAIGFRGGIKNFTYDIFISTALQKPQGYRTAQPAVGAHVTYQF